MTWLGGPLEHAAARVVSLVPSLTESVMRLGAAVVGRTSFCPGDADVVGGPQDASVERILARRPDVLLASPSENDRVTVEAVAAHCPVWLCDPRGPEQSPALWRELGHILGRDGTRAAHQAEAALETARAFLAARGPGPAVVCWVWRDPWIAAGRDTWISGMLDSAGFENAVREDGYPTVEPTRVAAELHVFPSEPYAFAPEDVETLGRVRSFSEGWLELEDDRWAALVPGEPLIWYPSHTVEGLALAQELRRRIEP